MGVRGSGHQQVPRAEHDGCGLLVRALEGHKAHGRALGGLADRLGIRHVVLLSLDERLHVSRRDQLHRVAELGDLLAFLATLPPCTVAMEACGSAHYWGRPAIGPTQLAVVWTLRTLRPSGASTWGNRGSESPHRSDSVGAGVEPTAALPIMMVSRGRRAIARAWALETGG